MERRRSPVKYDIMVGARIIVDTLENPGTFAWATVQSIIHAVKLNIKDLPEHYPHKTQPGMDLFLSTAAFTLSGFNYHHKTEGHYDSGTYFFATKKREGEVVRVPSQKIWKQPSFKM